jgi:2-dehydropantoate 2-reductase
MRGYIALPGGRELDRRTTKPSRLPLASGARPERMIVDPVPPSRGGRGAHAEAREGWLGQILAGYGDVKASMLQDFERGRTTEVDFINGYVGREFGVPAPVNAAIVQTVHAITRKQIAPGPALLGSILKASR